MNKRAIAILFLLTCASSFALVWGLMRAQSARGILLDYRVVYVGARCLIHGCDPYNETEVMRVYFAEGGERLPGPQQGQTQQYLAAQQLYPPTAELFFAPFALLSWPRSYALWVGISFGLMTTAAFLMWQAAQKYATDPPFFLACILLSNSGILFSGGNPAGIAVSLCVIGLWCILQNRFAAAGVLCLAVSLAIKPHDGGLLWLYLILLGGLFRKRAIYALGVVAVLAAFAVTCISRIAPNWLAEMRSNLALYSTGGATNDPAGGTASMMVNLQPVLAAIYNNPHFYNILTYAIVTPLFLALLFVILKSGRMSEKGIWLGVAAIATLSLLPAYHRPHDAKILLLTLPACAVLWAEKGGTAWMGLAFTSAGILITSDLPLAALNLSNAAFQPGPGFISRSLGLIAARPIGIVLLAASAFYVFSFVKHCRAEVKVHPHPASV
jgi:hypothetical protein